MIRAGTKRVVRVVRTRLRGGSATSEQGTAIIEFVFVAVIVMVPLVYAIAAVATAQRSLLAVRDAAREAGRAFATTDEAATAELTVQRALARVTAAVRISLHNQGFADDTAVRFVPAGAGCDTTPITPVLAPGAEFTICVRRRTDLPGIPSILSGRGVTTTGRYVVHVDDYRSSPG
jgi:Flp pilus assembly protein TadG